MRSIMLMAFNNIRKKKVQSILISITIMVSAILLSTSIGLLYSMNKPFEAMSENLNASQDLLRFDNKLYNPDGLRDWWRQQKGVTTTEVLPFYDMKDKIVYKGEEIINLVQLTERPETEVMQDKLEILEGDKKSNPGTGEVWVPTSIAYANKMMVGDTLTVPTEKGNKVLKISAIVVDPQFSSNFISPVRMWIAPGELEQMIGKSNIRGAMLGLRFTDYSEEAGLWKKFEQYLGNPYMGHKLGYKQMQYIYNLVLNIIGSIMLIFSFVIIVIILFIISFTISSAILADYKTIGILKSQGFSPKNVASTYGLQYMFISIISTLIGASLSYFTVELIIGSLIQTLGVVNTSFSVLLPGIIAFATLIIMSAITTFVAALKAGRIVPVEAIRFGAPASKHYNKKNQSPAILKKLPVSIILGLKQVFSNKRHSIFLVLSTSVTIFVLVFSVNLYHTMSQMAKHNEFWGFDSRDISITRTAGESQVTHEKLMEKLGNDDRVKAAVPLDYLPTSAVPEYNGVPAQSIIGEIYEGNMDGIGLVNVDGRNPNNSNEISIGITTSKMYNKHVGDYFDLYLLGQKKTFLITGIYQTVNNSGLGYRLQMSVVKSLNPEYESREYAIKLKNPMEQDNFVKDYEKEYSKAVSIESLEDMAGAGVEKITSMMPIPIVFICLIFISVSFIIIFNSTLISIYENKSSFGIYKAIGMTATQIRKSILFKVLALGVIGIIIGIPLGLLISPQIMQNIMASQGVAKFPFDVSLPGTIIAIAVCIIITGLSAWIPSGKVLGINARNLIVE